MIADVEKCHHCIVKSLSKLLRGVTSKNNIEYYCVKCLKSFRIANKLKSHENVCKDYNNFHAKMPETYDKILKFNHEQNCRIIYIIV